MCWQQRHQGAAQVPTGHVPDGIEPDEGLAVQVSEHLEQPYSHFVKFRVLAARPVRVIQVVEEGGGKDHAVDHHNALRSRPSTVYHIVYLKVNLPLQTPCKLMTAASTSEPPVGSTRSPEFYYDDGNVVFEVHTSSPSSREAILTLHLPAGFGCPLSTP